MAKKWTAHIAILGKSGSRKSTFLKLFLEKYYLKGHKIIDFGGEGRWESGYYGFKNNHQKMINKMRRYGDKPRTFPFELYHPYSLDLPEKIPRHIKLFKIPFVDLTLSDILMVISDSETGKVSDVQESLVEICYTRTMEYTRPTLKQLIKSILTVSKSGWYTVDDITLKVSDPRTGVSIGRKLIGLYNSGMITDNPHAKSKLDIDSIMDDTKTITCFENVWLQFDRYKFLMWSFLLRQFMKYRGQKTYPPMVLGVRELQTLAPSTIDRSGQRTTRELMRNIGTGGRDNTLRLVGDTQHITSLFKKFRRAFYTLYVFKSDLVEVEDIRTLRYIPDIVANAIPRLELGVCVQLDDQIHSPIVSSAPMSRVKREGEDYIQLCKDSGLPFVNTPIRRFKKIKFGKLKETKTDEGSDNGPYKHKCNVCGYIWYSRLKHPTRCARRTCYATDWE